MRELTVQRATIVVDRPVCGTRPTDSTMPFTCDNFLPSFLPAGKELTVVERDGTRG